MAAVTVKAIDYSCCNCRNYWIRTPITTTAVYYDPYTLQELLIMRLVTPVGLTVRAVEFGIPKATRIADFVPLYNCKKFNHLLRLITIIIRLSKFNFENKLNVRL